jgi:hypothetical protein
MYRGVARRDAPRSGCGAFSRRHRRGLGAAGAAAAILSFAALTGLGGHAAASHARVLCGAERWTVKTLQDRPRLLRGKRVTFAYLVSRPAPARLPTTRRPFERHIFSVTAAVTHVDPQVDEDLHVILSDGQRTMITEAPAVGCTKGATAVRRRQMAQARLKVEVCAKAVVTGVAFWDWNHGQPGVAPNAIELHPILGFTCITKQPPPTPPPPPAAADATPSDG